MHLRQILARVTPYLSPYNKITKLVETYPNPIFKSMENIENTYVTYHLFIIYLLWFIVYT